MLTVKIVHPSAHETVVEATRVSYQPPNANGTDASECLFIESGDGAVSHWTDATVYVMNAAGSTVSKYHLGEAFNAAIAAAA